MNKNGIRCCVRSIFGIDSKNGLGELLAPLVKSLNKFKNLNRQFHCPRFKRGVEAHGDAVEDVHHKEGGRLHPSDLGRLKMTSGESDRQVL